MAVHVAHKAPADLTLDANAHQRFHYDPVTGHITGFDGRVLDVEGGSRAEGAAVIYFDKAPHLSPNQQWDWDGQRAAFVSRMGTGFVLDVKGATKPEDLKNGAELIVWRSTGKDNQKWDIDPFGIYRSRANAAFCIDVNGGPKPATGVSKVSLWAAHVTADVSAQIFKLREAANQRWHYDAKTGYVTGFDGRVLDVEGDAKVKGAKLFAYDRRSDAAAVNLNQQFDYRDGFLVSRASGLVVDVKGGKVENGTDLILWENNNGANQKWDIDANGFIRTHANTKFCLDLIGGPKPNKGAGTVKLYLSYL